MNQVTVSRSVCPFIPSSIPSRPSSISLSIPYPPLIHSSVHPSSIPLSIRHPPLIHPSSIPLSIPHPPLCLSLSLFLSLHPSLLSNSCLPSVHHSICPSLSIPQSIAHPSFHLSLHCPVISQSERCLRHCT